MSKLFKSSPQFVKEIDGRQVTGVFSVFGVKDHHGDIVHPGAFSKTFQERSDRFLHLWQHDFWSPPIARIDNVREIGREDLPPRVLERYPEATGGAEVTRTYLDTPRGNEVLTALQADSPLQMSFGFDIIRYEWVEDGAESEEVTKSTTRHLRELRLYETSDVLWGANDATVANKAAALSIPIQLLVSQLGFHLEAMKAGSRNNAADLERINQIAQLAIELGATNAMYIDGDDEEGDKAKETAVGEQGKTQSRAGKPLTLLNAQLDLLEFDLHEVLNYVSS